MGRAAPFRPRVSSADTDRCRNAFAGICGPDAELTGGNSQVHARATGARTRTGFVGCERKLYPRIASGAGALSKIASRDSHTDTKGILAGRSARGAQPSPGHWRNILHTGR